MKSITKILLSILAMLFTLISFLPAQVQEDSAQVATYELRGETFVYESNKSKTLFKDINVTFMLFKSKDATISIETVLQHDKAFIALSKQETFQEDNTSYWLKVNLGDAFPSGRFFYAYGDTDFTEHTFLPTQMLEKFTIEGQQSMRFTYDKARDPQSYYFKLRPRNFKVPFKYFTVSTPQTFYNNLGKLNDILLILGVIIGLILMAGIYNGAMYYYNKEISFLYYTLMQFCMVIMLYLFSGAFVWDETSFFSRNISFESVISIAATLFATLFTIHFLESKANLPKVHLFLKYMVLILGADLLISIFYRSLLVEYYLLPFLMLGLIYAGYKRMRQGYKPARFYLAGWTVLVLAVFLNIFMIGSEYTIIEPLYIGSAIEAILFSLALSYKMRMLAQEKEEQKVLMVQQSRLASLGEMIGNIAHQWRQPLAHLSYTFMNLKEAHKHGELDALYLSTKVDEGTKQLAFMSQTIDDFKNFYAPNKAKEDFSLATATQETLDIIKDTLKHNDIAVELIIKADAQIHHYKNEYKQVLLNLLANAKEALIDRVSKAPKITIVIDKASIRVEDNAGGIEASILTQIFDPYFSTKVDNSGIGLYMSKMIIEKNMDGKLEVSTNQTGTVFSITLGENSV